MNRHPHSAQSRAIAINRQQWMTRLFVMFGASGLLLTAAALLIR